MSLTYVGLRVRDLERSVRFYTEQLGLTERKRGMMSHGGVWVSLTDPETKVPLELNWYPPDSPYAVPYVPGEGLDHVAFDVADARAKIRELVAAGAGLVVEPWLEEGRYWIGYVTDPDGNWIEVQGPAEPGTSAPSGTS
jgi:lactoylglutathione lyase